MYKSCNICHHFPFWRNKIDSKTWLFIFSAALSMGALAGEERPVYTIGAYDDAFAKQLAVMKLGPIAASEVPSVIPASFLEQDKSYAGGEAFPTIDEACAALKSQLAENKLPADEHWHVYLLEPHWGQDTYALRTNDVRISHPVRVIKMVKGVC
ncbi:DVU_2496 family lipoprotein [Legionella erythra]|nr:DVU_2496 family lipoprotein [Legionella erythra]